MNKILEKRKNEESDSLVMSIPDGWKGTNTADKNTKDGKKHASKNNTIVLSAVLVVIKPRQREPQECRDTAATM